MDNESIIVASVLPSSPTLQPHVRAFSFSGDDESDFNLVFDRRRKGVSSATNYGKGDEQKKSICVLHSLLMCVCFSKYTRYTRVLFMCMHVHIIFVYDRASGPGNHFCDQSCRHLTRTKKSTMESPCDSAAILSNRTVEMRNGGGKKRSGEGDGLTHHPVVGVYFVL